MVVVAIVGHGHKHRYATITFLFLFVQFTYLNISVILYFRTVSAAISRRETPLLRSTAPARLSHCFAHSYFTQSLK